MGYKTVMHPDGRLEKIPNGTPVHVEPATKSLTDADYAPEAIKTKITARLVEELHDPTVKGMPLYKLCAELLDRIEGKPVQRQAILTNQPGSTAQDRVIEIVHVMPGQKSIS